MMTAMEQSDSFLREVSRWVLVQERQSLSKPAEVCFFTAFWPGSSCLQQLISIHEGKGNLAERANPSCKYLVSYWLIHPTTNAKGHSLARTTILQTTLNALSVAKPSLQIADRWTSFSRVFV